MISRKSRLPRLRWTSDSQLPGIPPRAGITYLSWGRFRSGELQKPKPSNPAALADVLQKLGARL